jgi:antitoxin ParD1/3/4
MTMQITLPSALDAFVKDSVASGLYSSEAEVVADAVRRLAEQQREPELSGTDIAYLRKAWDEGIASGEAGPLDIEAIITEAKTGWAATGDTKGRAA